MSLMEEVLRLIPSLGASGNPTPQPDATGWTSCGQDAVLGSVSPPLHYSRTLWSLLGVWVLSCS